MIDPAVSTILIDDNETFLRQMTRYLEAAPGITVLGTARTGEEAVRLVTDLQPRVVLLDLTLGEENGLEILPTIKRRSPDSMVIVLTMHRASAYSELAAARGAAGFVEKSEVPHGVLREIRRVVDADVPG